MLDVEGTDEVQDALVACGYEQLQDLLCKLARVESFLPMKEIRKILHRKLQEWASKDQKKDAREKKKTRIQSVNGKLMSTQIQN